jgi:hypothetical protein
VDGEDAMSPTNVIRTRLLAVSAVTAIVVARITTEVTPQSKDLPAIRVSLVSVKDHGHLRGTKTTTEAVVQVDSLATSLSEARALADAVYGDGAGSGLAGFEGAVSTATVQAILPGDERQDFVGDEIKTYRVSRDYTVWFRG